MGTRSCRFKAPSSHPVCPGKDICLWCYLAYTSETVLENPPENVIPTPMYMFWPGRFEGNEWRWSDPVTMDKLEEIQDSRSNKNPTFKIKHVKHVNWEKSKSYREYK